MFLIIPDFTQKLKEGFFLLQTKRKHFCEAQTLGESKVFFICHRPTVLGHLVYITTKKETYSKSLRFNTIQSQPRATLPLTSSQPKENETTARARLHILL